MKTTIKWTVVTILCAIAALLWIDLNVVTTALYQDRPSKTVKSEIHRWILPDEEKILYQGPNFDPASAVWSQGVTSAFDDPLILNEIVLIKPANAKNCVQVQLLSVNMESQTAMFAIGRAGEAAKQIKLKDGDKLPVDGTQGVGWSQKDSGSVFIYSDEYWKNPQSSLYGARFIGSQQDPNKLDLAELADAEFRYVP